MPISKEYSQTRAGSIEKAMLQVDKALPPGSPIRTEIDKYLATHNEIISPRTIYNLDGVKKILSTTINRGSENRNIRYGIRRLLSVHNFEVKKGKIK